MNSDETVSRPELSPRSLLRSLWKQKAVLGITWAAISVLGAIIVRQLPAIYQAETLIQVEAPSVPEKFVSAAVNTDVQDRLSALREQILSYTRLLEVMQKFNLYPQERQTEPPEEIVARMRTVDLNIKLEKGWSRERAGAFRVSYQGRDPQVVAQVANEIGRLFIEENARTREALTAGASEFLESEFAKARDRLQRLEAQLTSYKLQYSGELPQQEQALTATLGRLQLQLQGAQDSLSRTEQAAVLLRNSLNSAQATETALTRMAAAESGENPAAITKLGRPLRESEKLKLKYESLRGRYSTQHPEMRYIQSEIARLEQLEKTAAEDPVPPEGAVPSIGAPAGQRAEVLIRERERVGELRFQLSAATQQIESLRSERDRTLSEISAAQSRLDKLPLREQQLASLTRDYETSKANYQSLLDKRLAARMAADVEKRQQSERFSVVDPARVPSRAIKPNRPLLAGLGSLLGLICGMALAFAKELKSNVLLGEWELPPEVMILGRIPVIPAAAGATGLLRTREWEPDPPRAAAAFAGSSGRPARGNGHRRISGEPSAGYGRGRGARAPSRPENY
jgi:polysaccharide chain length determinant protein (PEP-CTERM system associated)